MHKRALLSDVHTAARYVHTSSRRHVSATSVPLHSSEPHITAEFEPSHDKVRAPLSCLSLSTLLRAYAITSISSIPLLLRPSLATLSFMANAKSSIWDPDTNPVLRWILKKTFYEHFCAGETPAEVKGTIAQLKETGYRGVILGYAREVVMSDEDAKNLEGREDVQEHEVEMWLDGGLKTVRLAGKGDFVALKFTGAGREALRNLRRTQQCSHLLEEGVHELCRLSRERGVRLLFDAEQIAVQDGIDRWTRYFMKEYNRKEEALVYGTYQAYLKRTPQVLREDLELAKKEGYKLGVKLVRGAYLGSDPRHLIWPTIEETHKCYDGIAEALMRKRWNSVLTGEGEMPEVDLVLATHNRETVLRAGKVRDEQATRGEPRVNMVYGQLMGMADNVGCELVQAGRARREMDAEGDVDIPKTYKYLVHGSVAECLKYLVRRAEENRDAIARTAEGRRALRWELARRLGLVR